MLNKTYLTLAAMVFSISPALAATQYYVAQDAKTHLCKVVTSKPDGKSSMVVGPVAYSSQTAADAALKAAKECKK